MLSSRWIGLLAYDGRLRHAADRRRQDVDAARLASIHSRVIADLRRAIALDIEAFVAAVDQAPGSFVTCHNAGSPDGFVVRRVDGSSDARSLTVDLDEGTLRCRYEVTTPAADARSLTVHIAGDGGAVSLWTAGFHHVFATIDALGAFLLAPILGAGYGLPPFVTPASSPAAMP